MSRRVVARRLRARAGRRLPVVRPRAGRGGRAGRVGRATSPDGRVEVVLGGAEDAVRRVVAELDGPRAPGTVTRVDVADRAGAGEQRLHHSVTNATSPRHGETPVLALTSVSGPVTLGIPQPAPTVTRGAGLTLSPVGKAVPVMAKALFGHVVAPAELRVVEENAVLRAKVRRLEQELERAARPARRRHRPRAALAGRQGRARARLTARRPGPRLTLPAPPAPGMPRPSVPAAPRTRVLLPVHLSSLTLKGFKSFASATTLRLEPGITAVVGPNGSGKSNVVDAIAWVLGEQGAKSLRGGKMEDVIFAGTAGRPALGRAEVTLTIDNADGALPIEYTEVSITRRMYRSGESEYEINGDKVRLLDVQELLSDSGIGREMHVIVGQGQLDAVLSGRPEDRRAFIEEAAGVLKHRKRKEKALRKLDGMQAQPRPAGRPHRRAAPPAQAARPAGRGRPPGRRRAGRPARRPAAAARRRPRRSCATPSTGTSPTRRRPARAAPQVEAEPGGGLAAGGASSRARLAGVRAAAAGGVGHLVPALGADRAVPRRRPARRRAAPAPVGRRAGRRPPAATPTSSTPRPTGSPPPRPSWPPGWRPSAPGWPPSSPSAAELETPLAEAERAWVAAARALADRREGLARLSGQVAAARSRVERRAGRDRAARARRRRGGRPGRGAPPTASPTAGDRWPTRRTPTSPWSPPTRTPSPRTPQPPAGDRADRGRARRRARPRLLAGPPRRPRAGADPGRRRRRACWPPGSTACSVRWPSG